MVRLRVASRPAAADPGDASDVRAWRDQMITGPRLVFGDPRLRLLVGLAWLATFWVVPEGLAAPYAADLHGCAVVVGLLLAAQPMGAGVGGMLLSRFVKPADRLRLMSPLTAVCCLPLILFATHPGLVPALVLLLLSGVGASYNVPANTAFVQTVPAAQRGQAFGLVAAGLAGGQGAEHRRSRRDRRPHPPRHRDRRRRSARHPRSSCPPPHRPPGPDHGRSRHYAP